MAKSKCIVLLMLILTIVTSYAWRPIFRPPLPWIPIWTSCVFDTETNGPVCFDCTSTLICTPRGGMIRNCFGDTPFCNLGVCSAVPTEDCLEDHTEVYSKDYLQNDDDGFDGEDVMIPLQPVLE